MHVRQMVGMGNLVLRAAGPAQAQTAQVQQQVLLKQGHVLVPSPQVGARHGSDFLCQARDDLFLGSVMCIKCPHERVNV